MSGTGPIDSLAGKFVVVDGVDGCGKTTIASMLRCGIERGGHSVVTTREPGGTWLGEQIRESLLSMRADMGNTADVLLFMAARVEHAEKVIKPTIAAGTAVVCERWTTSTLAYQGVCADAMDLIADLDSRLLGDCRPDLTIILNPRGRESRGLTDRIEVRGDGYHAGVAERFCECADILPRCVLVDWGPTVAGTYQNVVGAIAGASGSGYAADFMAGMEAADGLCTDSCHSRGSGA